MAVVLLQVDAIDNATTGVQKVATSLGTLGTAAEQAGAKSAKLQAEMLRQESALIKLATGQQRYTQSLQTNMEALIKAANAEAAYQDALARRAGILSGVASGTVDAAGATTQLADANLRVAETYKAFGTSQDSAIRNTQRLDGQLAALKSTQAGVLTSQERLNAALKEQPVPKETAAGGGSSGGGRGGMVGSALSMGGYMLAYGTYSALTSSVGRSALYSQTQGSTAAGTGLSAAEMSALAARDTALAGSGTQPYQQNALLAGQYSLASLGIGKNAPGGMGQAVFDISAFTTKMSGAANAPDTSQATDTIASMIADWHMQDSATVVSWSKAVADQLQVAVKVGKAEMPDLAAQVALPASKAMQLGIGTGDVLNFLASESAGGIPTGQLGDELNSLMRSSETATKNYRQKAVSASLFKGSGETYDAGYWGREGLTGGSALIEKQLAGQGITGSRRVAVLDSLFANTAASQGFTAAQNGNLFGNARQMAGASGGTGAVQQAFETSQQYAGMKLQDAEAKLATSFDNLTTQALPGLIAAITLAANGLESLPGVNSWLDNLAKAVDLPGKGAAIDRNMPGGATGFAALMNMTPAGPIYDALKAASLIMASHPRVDNTLPSGGGTTQPRGGGMALGPLLNPNPQGWGEGNRLAAQEAAINARPAIIDYAAGQDTTNVATMTGVGGGAGRTPPAVQLALNRLKNAISANAGQNAVESALGLYRQTVEAVPSAVMPGGTKTKDIYAAEKLASAYEAGPLTNAAQLMVDAKQGMLTAAEQQGQTPAALKAIFDSYIEAQRQLVMVSTKPGSAAQTRALGALDQSKATGDYGYGTDIVNRTVKDLTNKVSMDKLGTDTGATAKDMAALLAYETTNAKRLGLDASDLALMKAQNAQSTTLPKSNLRPFSETNAGLAAFGAGPGSTAVRLGGAEENPVVLENRMLRTQVTRDNAQIISLLAQLVAAGIKPNVASAGRGVR